jgi:hypothetical protein
MFCTFRSQCVATASLHHWSALTNKSFLRPSTIWHEQGLRVCQRCLLSPASYITIPSGDDIVVNAKHNGHGTLIAGMPHGSSKSLRWSKIHLPFESATRRAAHYYALETWRHCFNFRLAAPWSELSTLEGKRNIRRKTECLNAVKGH